MRTRPLALESLSWPEIALYLAVSCLPWIVLGLFGWWYFWEALP